ncbi:hypothetical protein NUW58_g6830 [Xylaria curta]|uniref:Uncharacterized protein n=1 Tax=Xylaria curta TaxID=42375 RepID=A0ACC1NPT5_9PEZI|nr:hypothetical protein NUW58_g6830 [Xylaria curta]
MTTIQAVARTSTASDPGAPPALCKTNLGRDLDLASKIAVFVFLAIFARTAKQDSHSLARASTLGPERNGHLWYHDILHPEGGRRLAVNGNYLVLVVDELDVADFPLRWVWRISRTGPGSLTSRGYANIVAPDSPALASSLQSADAEVSSRVPAVDRVEDIAQANDVHDPSWDYPPRAAPGPGVYGLVYRLHPLDEDALDGYEGVPFAYDREILEAVWVEVPGSNSVPISSQNAKNTTSRIAFKELARGTEADSSGGAASFATGKMFEALVYVDRLRVTPSTPKGEYVHRMNSGIEEALTEWGLPAAYVDEVMRPYIPAP